MTSMPPTAEESRTWVSREAIDRLLAGQDPIHGDLYDRTMSGLVARLHVLEGDLRAHQVVIAYLVAQQGGEVTVPDEVLTGGGWRIQVARSIPDDGIVIHAEV